MFPAQGKRHFGRYRLLYRFASGGMAQVYLARLSGADGFEKLVAIKVIHQHLTEQEEFVKMFIDEARLASRIAHPNVVQIIELGKVEQTHFIAMEYVAGESLASLLRHTRPPLPICARIIADAAAGLHAAHELRDQDGEPLNVVHRDVSPQNILITYEGATKVVDFGVARARGSLHTTRGELKGKLAYMAPEQLTEKREIDRRTDVFALGIVLFELTTRRRLFKAESEQAQIAKVLHGEIVPPSQVIPDYPQELEAIVLKALERDPEQRFQSARELQMALERFILATGHPVLQDEVGELMKAQFTQRIAEKQEQLRRAEVEAFEDSSIPDVEMASNMSMALGTMGSLLQAAQRRRHVMVLVVGLLVAALVTLGVILLLRRDPAPAEARAPGPRPTPDAGAAATAAAPDAGAPRQVSISVRATPARATILLDGKPVANPFEITQPARQGQAELVVRARGFEPQAFRVPLDRGGTWVVALVRPRRNTTHGPRPNRGPTKTLAPAKKHTPAKKPGSLGDEDVVVNPYQ